MYIRTMPTKKNSAPRKNVTMKAKKNIYRSVTKGLNTKPSINVKQFNTSYNEVKKRIAKLSKTDLKLLEEALNQSLRKKAKRVDVSGMFELYASILLLGSVKKLVAKTKKCTKKMNYVEANPLRFPLSCLGSYKLIKRLGAGMSGTAYLVEDKSKAQKVVKIQKIDLYKFAESGGVEDIHQQLEEDAESTSTLPPRPMRNPITLTSICDQLGYIQREVKNQQIAAEVGIAPKIYEHYFCVDYRDRTLLSYTVMDHIDGITLSDWMLDNKLTKDDRKKLIKMVDILHSTGLIHSDLHSDNVMVTTHDGTTKFYLIDYGATKGIQRMMEVEKEGVVELLNASLSQPLSRSKIRLQQREQLAIWILVDFH